MRFSFGSNWSTALFCVDRPYRLVALALDLPLYHYRGPSLSLYRCLFSLNPKSIELVAPLSHGLPCRPVALSPCPFAATLHSRLGGWPIDIPIANCDLFSTHLTGNGSATPCRQWRFVPGSCGEWQLLPRNPLPNPLYTS